MKYLLLNREILFARCFAAYMRAHLPVSQYFPEQGETRERAHIYLFFHTCQVFQFIIKFAVVDVVVVMPSSQKRAILTLKWDNVLRALRANMIVSGQCDDATRVRHLYMRLRVFLRNFFALVSMCRAVFKLHFKVKLH